MIPAIAPIVEGHSETEAVPILLRRILSEHGFDPYVSVARPFRIKRYKVVKEGELERAIEFLLNDRRNVKAILVLLDADDDCPVELAVDLLRRCNQAASLPSAVVVASREFECWFLGAKESLQGRGGIHDNAASPANPESIRDAKKRLTENMTRGRQYIEVDDQPSFASWFEIKQARKNCPSLDKFCREVLRLAQQIVVADSQ